jgi:hypothetical protein
VGNGQAGAGLGRRKGRIGAVSDGLLRRAGAANPKSLAVMAGRR